MEKNYRLIMEDFGVLLADSIKDRVGDEVSVEYTPVTKNNGVKHHAVLFRKEGTKISPTIYIDSCYDRYLGGETIDNLASEVINIYNDCLTDKDIDVSFFMDFSQVCEHLAFRAINYEKNKKQLENVPYRKFEDLAFIPICVLNNFEDQSGTVVINRQHLKIWEISEDELWENVYEHAGENYPASITGIEKYISDRTGIDIGEVDSKVLVVSNEDLCYGAAEIFFPGVMPDIAKKLKSDVLILPSSVHETIVLPSSGDLGLDYSFIDMVKEVNLTTLASEEVLSDNVYYYNAKEDSFAAVGSLLSAK